jgi:hypothetical protein
MSSSSELLTCVGRGHSDLTGDFGQYVQVTRQRDRSRFGATRIVGALRRARAHVKDSGWSWAGRHFPVATGCAAHIPGEGSALGGVLAATLTAAATWAILAFVPRLRGGRSQLTVASVSGWQLALDRTGRWDGSLLSRLA